MVDRCYHLEVSAEVAKCIIRQIDALKRALETAEVAAMRAPTVAFNGRTALWGDAAQIDGERHYNVQMDVAALTGGRLDTISSKQFQEVLFNDRYGDIFVDSLMLAMMWVNDIDSHGENAHNASRVDYYQRTVLKAMRRSVEYLSLV